MRNILRGLLAAALLTGCGGSELDAAEPLPTEDGTVTQAATDCQSCIAERSECYSTAETYPQKVLCSQAYTACRAQYCP
ncbi:hypothetical protein LZ198_40790 [Myxococcus sp. K15C18031901]|uniref:hypothetical protein n=1 Tax=Myxococcus dinghuensis TaxID=2906761 RepID=UPI0020A7D2C6|nr:hypothetical protein [Myxococcus dinghuensis]MCP3105226.1 hypothetical protein [Myxococcus dinghuensis]